jgi:hypothetical protein
MAAGMERMQCFVSFPDENATMILIGNKYNRNIYNAAKAAYNLFGNYLPGESQQYDDQRPG